MKKNMQSLSSRNVISKQTLTTERQKSSEFEFFKQKYCGSNSKLRLEQQELKMKLEEQR